MSSTSIDPAQQLRDLVSIITNAVDIVISTYNDASIPIPTLNETSQGPFDSPDNAPASLSRAIMLIEAACTQLSYTVARPGHTVINKSLQLYESPALLFVCNAKIADILKDRPEGMHVLDIASTARVDPDKLGRILRMFATKHIFREVKPKVFANNRLSVKLYSDDPVSSFVGRVTDDSRKGTAVMDEVLRDPLTAFSTSKTDACFARAYGCTPFEHLNLPENKDRLDRFSKAMVGFASAVGKGALARAYPWDTCKPGTTICDIGGGNGHAMLNLVNTFPHVGLRLVIQDQPSVIKQAQKFWLQNKPDLFHAGEVKFEPIDFFASSPISGCDFYYLRQVLHDWPASECLQILKNVSKVMKANSTLFIDEMVLQHAVRSEHDSLSEQAPEPLLPNFGAGRIRHYYQDMHMMNMYNAKERMLEEFVSLGERCGLRFVRLREVADLDSGVVEFAVAAQRLPVALSDV